MAWKRDDPPGTNPQQPEPPSPPRPMTAAAPAPSAAPEPPRRSGERATIGPSIFIKGDLAGEEDLVIEGRVEGKVDLKQHNVTIGKNGRVKADVFGRIVTVEGEVDGNVFAAEQAVLRQSGAVRGNITSPRVTLEDGSRFKGSIDMDGSRAAGGSGGAGNTGSSGSSGNPGKAAANEGQANRPGTAASAG